MNRKTYHNDYGNNSSKCYNTLIKKNTNNLSSYKKTILQL